MKKFLIFSYISRKETLNKSLLSPEMEPCTFKPRLKKFKKKIHPEKISYALTFSQKKAVPIFQETETPKKFLIFSRKKAFLVFQETETPNKFFIFQETELYHILGKVYSEPWYIQNSSIFRTRSIFRTLVYSEPELYSEHYQTSTMKSFAEVLP